MVLILSFLPPDHLPLRAGLRPGCRRARRQRREHLWSRWSRRRRYRQPTGHPDLPAQEAAAEEEAAPVGLGTANRC